MKTQKESLKTFKESFITQIQSMPLIAVVIE